LDDHSHDDARETLRPIASLISKSAKAQQKLAPGTWQHAMLGENLKALRIASVLLGMEPGDADRFTPGELHKALGAIDSMMSRTENARAEFPPGTSHHSLQRNRLDALRAAKNAIEAALDKD